MRKVQTCKLTLCSSSPFQIYTFIVRVQQVRFLRIRFIWEREKLGTLYLTNTKKHIDFHIKQSFDSIIQPFYVLYASDSWLKSRKGGLSVYRLSFVFQASCSKSCCDFSENVSTKIAMKGRPSAQTQAQCSCSCSCWCCFKFKKSCAATCPYASLSYITYHYSIATVLEDAARRDSTVWIQSEN